MCDVLHTVANLQDSLQSKQLDLATVPVITFSRLMELKESPTSSTWFVDHKRVQVLKGGNIGIAEKARISGMS